MFFSYVEIFTDYNTQSGTCKVHFRKLLDGDSWNLTVFEILEWMTAARTVLQKPCQQNFQI